MFLLGLLVAVCGRSLQCGGYAVFSQGDANDKDVIFSKGSADDADISRQSTRNRIRTRLRYVIKDALLVLTNVRNHMKQKAGSGRTFGVQLESMGDEYGNIDTSANRHAILHSARYAAKHPKAFLNRLFPKVNTGMNVVMRANDVGQIGFFAMQIYGLWQTINAMAHRDQDGIHTFEFSSAIGIFTLLSMPGEVIGTVIEPFLMAQEIKIAIDAFKYNFKILGAGQKALLVRNARFGATQTVAKSLWMMLKGNDAPIAPGARIAAFSSAKFTKFLSGVNILAVGLMVPLTVIDVILSSLQLSDAISQYNTNEDPDFDDYYKHVRDMAVAQSGVSYACAILVGVLLLSPDPFGIQARCERRVILFSKIQGVSQLHWQKSSIF